MGKANGLYSPGGIYLREGEPPLRYGRTTANSQKDVTQAGQMGTIFPKVHLYLEICARWEEFFGGCTIAYATI